MARMTTAPMIQAKMAAGPAIMDACQAPNNQPDPIIEPKPVNISDIGPMFRFVLCMCSPLFFLCGVNPKRVKLAWD
ncbi:hypothetical protein EMIT0194P_20540 [Pseudomonas serbica]